MVPRLGGGGRSCAEQVGQVKPHWKTPCRKAPAPSGADSQGHCLVKISGYFFGLPEVWITRTFALLKKFRKEHCCLDVSQLNAQIQGLYPVHCLSADTANEVIN